LSAQAVAGLRDLRIAAPSAPAARTAAPDR
jgi:hypothetical protein